MKKKILALLVITIMLISLIPQTALATTYTLDSSVYNAINTNGVTIYMNYGKLWLYYYDCGDSSYYKNFSISDGDTIQIADNAKVRLIGEKDVNIVCGSNVTLVLESVTTEASDGSAVEFTGTGNTLILNGTSSLEGAYNDPGIRVLPGAELEIKGGGRLDVTGGIFGAGIGGGFRESCGTVTISECTLNATGVLDAAGIGGGGDREGNGGIITINSGTVTAKGDGAGIGGGSGDGDLGGDGGTVTINGGTVIAQGSTGIGGGYLGAGGTVTINGGLVLAKGYGLWYDIGKGYPLDDDTVDAGTLEIGGDAIVLLGNDHYAPVTTSTHTHIPFKEAVGGKVYGYTLPSYWGGVSAFAIVTMLTYDDNGGTGGTSIAAPKETTQTVISGSALSKPGYTFVNWNTHANGGGDTYEAGDSIVMSSNITLYAIWESVAVTGVDITSDVEILSPGGIAALTANVTPSGAADKSLDWSSDDTSVATVDSRGVVTAVSEGSALITAKSISDPSYSDTCQVAVSSVLMNYALSTGSTMEMTAAVSPTGNTAVWTSDKPGVAEVDDTGKVTAKSPGLAMVKVTAGGVSQTVGVAVYDQTVTSVKLSRASVDLTVDDSIGLTAYVDPDGAVNKDVTWTSDDEDVATVNSSGKVTAVGKGNTTVTAQSGGQLASCTIEVTLPVASVSIGSSSKKMLLNETADITATVSPSEATHADITWTSSDESIVTVDITGKVTAEGFGSTTVIAEAGGKYDTCTVSVVKTDVTGVSLNSSSETLKKGDSVTLSAAVLPSDATYPGVMWTSSDTDIATVDASGMVTAKNFGIATITAEADGVTAVCTVSVVKTAVTGVSLNRTYKEMGVGDSLTLDATVTPGDSTYPDATWTSTNTSVATVSQSGKVTAKTEGAAAIIADVDGKYAVCAVLVSNGANNDNSSDDNDDSTTQTPEPTVSPTASRRARRGKQR